MKKYKHLIIIILLALAIPLAFWWGVGRGREIDSTFTFQGEELIRLQNDIQRLQLHVAVLVIKNNELKKRISVIQTTQDTIKIHIPQ